jgi:hypothetical protein
MHLLDAVGVDPASVKASTFARMFAQVAATAAACDSGSVTGRFARSRMNDASATVN